MAKRGRNIILIGFMASGKTAVGRHLARRLGLKFVDVDRSIERAAGRSVNGIFRSRGEAAFRRMETAAIRRLATAVPRVIATGGGAPVSARNRALLRRAGRVVYLKVPAAVLARRLRRAVDRPVLKPAAGDFRALRSLVARFLGERERHYTRADLTVRAGRDRPAQIAERIARLMKYKVQSSKFKVEAREGTAAS